MTTRIGLAGDWHGSTGWARSAIAAFGRQGILHVHHVGDFGLGWPGGWNQYINEVAGACVKNDVYLYITPGNHENYDYIAGLFGDNPDEPAHITDRVCVLPRGYRSDLHYEDANGDAATRSYVSLGGAPSIDFEWRQEGLSWWQAEMITLEEAEKVAADGYADIMITHDAPDGGTDEVQRIIDTPWRDSGWSDRGLRYAKEGRMLMNIAFQGVRPKVFVHGHFHVGGEAQRGDTKFLSLDCDGSRSKNLVILNLETLDHEWVRLVA